MTGVGVVLRLARRRDGLVWALWALALVFLMPLTASKYHDLVPVGADPQVTLAPITSSPSMLGLLGPAFSVASTGGFVYWRVGGFTALMAALAVGFLVIRATRVEEDAGRAEMLRAGVVSPHAPLLAAALEAVIGSLAIGVLSAVLAGAAGLGWAGSWAAGASIAAGGLVMAGPALVCAQLFGTARSARGWCLGLVYGGLFLARMGVDAQGTTSSVDRLRWVIPLEWPLLARPWAGDRWWVFLVPLLWFVALAGLAVVLESRRDHGSGLRQPRPGPDRSRLTVGPALSWRLERGLVLGWFLGTTVAALGTGSILEQASSTMRSNPAMARMLEAMGGSDDVTIASDIAMLSIIGSILLVMAVTLVARLRSEETAGRVEPLLATTLPRTRLILGQLGVALVATSITLVAAGAAVPLSSASSSGDWGSVARYLGAAAALLPGVWLLVGLTAFLVGCAPRLVPLAWVVVGWTIAAAWLGPVLGLPGWAQRLQPFGHLAVPPRDVMDWRPFLVESAVALVLGAAGVLGWRRRDVPA
ncbi:ABC transporter permease [Acidipropionibacterium timonense]|uniref:ABC transporter permease n=1 Tax=Acidipropionibacterium timonense TaxID=2161818 RepID=UPI0010305B17|nr:ABC transporter permease [Acidipropionibacterium timonense]